MLPTWAELSLRIVGILIPSGIAIWLGCVIRNKIESEKLLKNYLVNDILEIRKEYRNLCDSVKTGGIKPKKAKSDLSNISTHITDLMHLILSKYKTVDKNFLMPYQLDISQIITEDDNYILSFKENKEFIVSQQTMDAISAFEKNNNHLFNDLILLVYK